MNVELKARQKSRQTTQQSHYCTSSLLASVHIPSEVGASKSFVFLCSVACFMPNPPISFIVQKFHQKGSKRKFKKTYTRKFRDDDGNEKMLDRKIVTCY